VKKGPAFAPAPLSSHLINRLHDSVRGVSDTPGSVVGLVNRARLSEAEIAIAAEVMTGKAVCDASATEVRAAEAAHMGCADATEVGAFSAELRGAHSTEARSAEASDMAAAEATDMASAESADVTAAKAAAETTDMTAAAHTAAHTAAKSAATASVSGASCGKSEHDDRCCCSEKLRHDESPFLFVSEP
jgi:hypothetical protein